MTPIFISGIGTGVGKTLVAAIVAEALQADYWKPVQAGFAEGTDREWVQSVLSGAPGRVHPETYKLALPASPHIAARQEELSIRLEMIVGEYRNILSRGIAVPGSRESAPGRSKSSARWLVIEGAGGLLVPLNDKQFMADLVKALDAPLLLVSRNYLGSINHSLLTAEVCKTRGLPVAGWIFNDQYLQYEEEIAGWSGWPAIAAIPYTERPDASFVKEQAERIRPALLNSLKLVAHSL